MKHPLEQIEQLITDKKAVYFNAGTAVSGRGKYFCTIWGRPSSESLACGHGDTLEDAMRTALAKVKVTGGGLPGLTTRPSLPGMTR